MTALIQAARANGDTILLPTSVIAETWRGVPHARVARLRKSINVEVVLDAAAAERVGALLADAESSQIVDGHVVAIATANLPAMIVTADARDIRSLLDARGISHAPFDAKKADAEVLVFAL
jgi:hypothetical protein